MGQIWTEDKLNELELRVKKIENLVIGPNTYPLADSLVREAREGAQGLVKLSERVRGKWKGGLSSVEEVRKMRRHERGY